MQRRCRMRQMQTTRAARRRASVCRNERAASTHCTHSLRRTSAAHQQRLTLPQEVKGARVIQLHCLADIYAVQLVLVHQHIVLCSRAGGQGSKGQGRAGQGMHRRSGRASGSGQALAGWGEGGAGQACKCTWLAVGWEGRGSTRQRPHPTGLHAPDGTSGTGCAPSPPCLQARREREAGWGAWLCVCDGATACVRGGAEGNVGRGGRRAAAGQAGPLQSPAGAWPSPVYACRMRAGGSPASLSRGAATPFSPMNSITAPGRSSSNMTAVSWERQRTAHSSHSQHADCRLALASHPPLRPRFPETCPPATPSQQPALPATPRPSRLPPSPASSPRTCRRSCSGLGHSMPAACRRARFRISFSAHSFTILRGLDLQ